MGCIDVSAVLEVDARIRKISSHATRFSVVFTALKMEALIRLTDNRATRVLYATVKVLPIFTVVMILQLSFYSISRE